MTSDELTETSRSETFQQQKSLLANVEIPSDFSDELNSNDNCLQVVELSTSMIVFDFSSSPCPGESELAKEEGIVFTSSYRKKLGFLNQYELLLDGKPIGAVQVLGKGNSAQLSLLCNEEYENLCESTTRNGRWFSPPEISSNIK